jgi:Lon protease-like protein
MSERVQLPLFPLGTVLFPGMVLPLHIFEQRYRLLMARRVDQDPAFGIVLTRKGREVGDRPEIHAVGTAASLLRVVRYLDGRYDIAVGGGRRFRVFGGHWDEGYLTGTVEWIDDSAADGSADDEDVRQAERVQRAFGDYLDVLERIAGEPIERGLFEGDPVTIAFAICSLMPFDTALNQRLLEAESATALLDDLLTTLRHERELLLTTGIGGVGIDHPGTRFSVN